MAISILQDPVESNHAKNTARLANLILPQVRVFVGEKPSDFVQVRNRVQQYERNLLIYPSDKAINIQQLCDKEPRCQHLILLDGSWRKAKKLWLANEWLHELDAGYLALANSTEYTIRKSTTEHSLSTLEALGHTLHLLEDAPLTPVFDVLNALQSHWHSHQK